MTKRQKISLTSICRDVGSYNPHKRWNGVTSQMQVKLNGWFTPSLSTFVRVKILHAEDRGAHKSLTTHRLAAHSGLQLLLVNCS